MHMRNTRYVLEYKKHEIWRNISEGKAANLVVKGSRGQNGKQENRAKSECGAQRCSSL